MTGPAEHGFALRGELDGEPLLLPLLPGLNHVGWDPACHLQLKTAGVSKRHADLRVEGGTVSVADLASKNGTFVNRRRIEHAAIRPGDRVAFGGVSLVLERIHPDEARIAVDLGLPRPQEARLPTTESRHPSADFEEVSSFGLGAATRFVEALGSPGSTDPFSGALRLLAREPMLDGLCLFSTPDDGDRGEPELLASAGDLRALDVPAVVDVLGRSTGKSAFEARLDASETGAEPMLLLADPPRRRALLAWGSRVDTSEVRALLRLVSAILRRFAAGEDGPASATASADKLVFPPGYVVGTSSAMEELYRRLQPIVHSDLPVLVLGETGTGKESVAQILHASSDRARRPLVTLNCAAIPHDLIEAELFGIGGGVATGVSAREGKFQEADGGTLFLDEVGDLPLSLQAKLLRALQDGDVRPVGRKAEPVDVRIVAATNGDLEAAMEAGRFRRDLYYRLAGLVLHLPPLRRRVDDLPALVTRFLRRETEKADKVVRGMTVGAMRKLAVRPWPGNVRELEHEVRRLVYAAGPNPLISAEMVSVPPAEADRTNEVDFSRVENLDLGDLEKAAVIEALRRSDGQVTDAARRLGITRQTLRRRMGRYGL